ncbi:MAG: hypothetical protein LBM01_01425 [Christensenellaceae bacterium]|jgi:FtsZ-interacting cell division protein ZipA|nr:hypothetical protein [Christensenellaceae bacterium]
MFLAVDSSIILVIGGLLLIVALLFIGDWLIKRQPKLSSPKEKTEKEEIKTEESVNNNNKEEKDEKADYIVGSSLAEAIEKEIEANPSETKDAAKAGFRPSILEKRKAARASIKEYYEKRHQIKMTQEEMQKAEDLEESGAVLSLEDFRKLEAIKSVGDNRAENPYKF